MAYRKGLNPRLGESKTRLYSIWNNIRLRCRPKLSKKYPNYSGRGIKICKEWDNSFLCFKEWALQNGWNDSHKRGEFTIERINNDGDYCPENCILTNMKTQARNRRSNSYYTIKGKRYLFCELAEKYNLPWNVLNMRLLRLKENDNIDEVLKRPIQHKRIKGV